MTIVTIILTLLKIIFLLIGIAYFTIAERKIMAAVQRRHGPDVVGFPWFVTTTSRWSQISSKRSANSH